MFILHGCTYKRRWTNVLKNTLEKDGRYCYGGIPLRIVTIYYRLTTHIFQTFVLLAYLEAGKPGPDTAITDYEPPSMIRIHSDRGS